MYNLTKLNLNKKYSFTQAIIGTSYIYGFSQFKEIYKYYL